MRINPFAATLALVVPLAPLPALAALSGYHDSAAQMAALLQSPQLADALGQRPIREVSFEGTRPDGALIWEVDTQGCDIEVTLSVTPPQGAGPNSYAVAMIGPCDD